MQNNYGINWDSLKSQFDLWWHQSNTDRPLISIKAPLVRGQYNAENDRWVESSAGTQPAKAAQANGETKDYSDYWLDFSQIMSRNRSMFETSYFAAESYPRMFANLGVASLAVFLGCEPLFAKDTIWYKHVLDDPETAKIALSPDSRWLDWSLDTTRRAVEAADGSFRVGIPDLCEHLDVLASLFDTQELLFHMMDYPDEIMELTKQVQQHWFSVYDQHYQLVREPDGFCNYGPFQLMGKGRTAKLQCDMSAMIGVEMFDSFVLPFLDEQTRWLDNSLYHLDGPDALKHLDSVLSLEKLNALQWTPGAGNCDGGDEEWDFLYKKALDAGKSIYALVGPKNIKRFVKKFGHRGIFIMTNAADRAEADEIMEMLKA